MRVAVVAGSFLSLGFLCASAPASAAECPGGHPDALGVSRTLVVDPSEHPRVGTMQYAETLPLQDKEVVLTFDDGPLPRYSDRVLEILAADCVKATYFVVGSMARAYPDGLRRIYAAGHTIGTHSQNHPFTFNRMPLAKAEREIEDGIASAAMALGDPTAIAPFFRIPGLLRAEQVETYLTSRHIMTWSADFPADDWKRKVTDRDIVRLALERLEAKGKGILLLHDIHPATVLALPVLLRELKERGYKIVHVVPANPDRPKTATAPGAWSLGKSSDRGWPRALAAKPASALAALPVPAVAAFETTMPPVLPPKRRKLTAGEIPLPPEPFWPRLPGDNAGKDKTSALPAPDQSRFVFAALEQPEIPLRGTLSRTKSAGPRRFNSAFAGAISVR